MKWFKNLRTAVKLTITFLTMSAILAVVGIYSLVNLSKMNDSIGLMYDERVIPLSNLGTLETDYQRLRVQIRDMVFVAQTKEEKDVFNDKVMQIIQDIQENLAKYEKYRIISEEQNILDQLHPSLEEYLSILDEAKEFAYANDIEGYLGKAADFNVTGNAVQGHINDLIKLNIDLAKESNDEAGEQYSSAQAFTIAVIVLFVLLNIGLGIVISRLISKPLKDVSELVETVANGDLTATISIDTKDEVGDLARSVNRMVSNLKTTVESIHQSAESVSASAEEISATTEEVASSATTQANDSQQITELFKEIVKGSESQSYDAQTMKELFEELNQAIYSIAKSADETATLSETLTNVAKDGNQVVQASMKGMESISSQMTLLEQDAARIDDIIKVIDSIASQTNLLALNAAIEAARAGEHGKGFAVVADEVRKLAEQSSGATNEITSIIKGIQENTSRSVQAVVEGVDSTKRTEQSFTHIVQMMTEVNENVMNIASASAQQSDQSASVMNAIESIASASAQQSAQSTEVMKSVQNIAASSEEVAAASEETAATTQALANLSEELNGLVSVFKIRN